jgi:hypothetical protein
MLLSSGKFAMYRAESDVFFRIAPAFGNLKHQSNRGKLMDAWLRSDYFARSGLNAADIRARILSGCGNPGDFLRIVMESIARAQGVRRWADNTPFHILYMDRIKETIPNARFVHVIRDGRDVALSLNRLGWPECLPWDAANRLAISGLYWRWFVSQGRASGGILGADYRELRYEELVARPRDALAGLGDFIGEQLDYDRIRANPIGTVARPNSSFPYKEPLSSIRRWESLSDAKTSQLKTVQTPLLRELGYQTDDSTTSLAAWRLTGFYFAYWWLKNKIKRSPVSRFLVSRDRLEPGSLDRFDARWESIRSGTQDPTPAPANNAFKTAAQG